MTSRLPQSLSEDRVDDTRIRNPVLDTAADFNARNAAANPDLVPALLDSSSSSTTPIHFRSTTIAPSPTLPDTSTVSRTSSSSSSSKSDDLDSDSYVPGPLTTANGLRVQTNVASTASQPRKGSFSLSPGRALFNLARKSSAQSLKGVSRTPSLKAALANSIGSSSVASSTVPSPIILAMGDVTPLPSPLLSSDSPGPWKRLAAARPTSRDGLLPVPSMQDSVLVSSNGESISAALANQAKRKAYSSLNTEQGETAAASTTSRPPQHNRNRSTSEYIPDPKLIPQRHITVTGAHSKKKPEINPSCIESRMRREPHLSAARGLTPTSLGQPPTPPPSEPSESALDRAKSKREYFEAHGRHDKRLRRWRAVKYLGQGTFSKVILATSQISTHNDELGLSNNDPKDGLVTPMSEIQLNRKTLVAIKICEHGPRGGASEDRVEMSLKRELEILRSIHHPSLVHLKAWNIEPTRALLVLSYCPGGDLFDIASQYRDVLTASLLRRIFAELVGAVRYLHDRRIVHRDIKLENVLVNLTPVELSDSNINWQSYPYSVVTLADLGLSRRIADDEKLETRCGSDDYAAPEVILGQAYDGRATDAWSLGVLLYAMIESRLPFDPPPGMPDAHRLRSRTSHRIARVEWRWIEYAGGDGDHDGNETKFKSRDLLGAMEITEGLLKRARSRWTMSQVAEHEWVKGGIQIEGGDEEFGGLKFRDEDEGEEVLR